MKLEDHYDSGSIVISPYGLAAIDKLFDEPLKERPSKSGEAEWPDGLPNPNLAAARIWVNGHGEETIEIDQLVPATPETMAMWNLLGNYDQPTTEEDA
jgi:hypothetical protein